MVATPTLTAISYNGTRVFLSCVPPSDPTYTQYQVTVTDTTSGTTVTQATVPALMLGIPVSLGSDAYNAAVAFSNGTTAGPASVPGPIVAGPAPTISQVTCTYETLSAVWTPVAGRTLYGLQAQWDQSGTLSYVTGTSGTVYISPTISPQPVSVVVNVYAAQTLPGSSLTWSTGPQASVTVNPSFGGTVFRANAPIYATGPRYTTPQNVAVVPAAPADVGRSALGNPPPGAPNVTMVNYNGSSLVVGWQTLSTATGYQAYLASPTGTTQTQAVTGAGGTLATFAQSLSSGSWGVSVAAVTVAGGTTIIGPPSYPYNPIVDPPTLTSVCNDVNAITLMWAPVTYASAYFAAYGLTGTTGSTVYAGTTTRTISGNFTTNTWTCAIQAIGSGGVVVGPPGTPSTLIATQAGWTEGDYDGQHLSLTWTPANDPNVSGYLLSIQGGAGSTQSIPNTTAATLAQALSPSLQYQALIYATNGIVRGPSSPALVLLSAPPQSGWLGFNGTSVCGAWSPPTTGAISGYTAQLAANGTVVDTQAPTGTTTTFSSGLSAGVIYSATVRAVSQGANIPTVRGPGVTVPGPYSQSTTYGFDGIGRLATQTWGTVATQSYSFDSAGNLLTITGTSSGGSS